MPAIPGSAQSGPTVWNQNQETSALEGERTIGPEYEAKGIPLGGPFRLYPNVMTSLSYDDNVFRVKSGAKDDFFFTESPTLVLDYETNEAHLALYGDGSLNQYTRLSSVNNDEYDFGARGSYLISHAAQMNGNISYSQMAEPLSSPEAIGDQARPTLYTVFDASGQVSYQPNRLGVTVGGSYDDYHYLSTPELGGGTLFNKDRNNSLTKVFTSVNYDFSPGYSAFVRGTYNEDNFATADDRAGYNRTSHGTLVDGGVNLLLTDLIQGTVYLGYVDQIYNHNPPDSHKNASLVGLSDVSGLDFGANLTWYPTELLTVKLTAARQLSNTTMSGAAAGDDRNVGLLATYELTRQLLLTANVSYDDTTFSGANLTDRTTSFGVGAKYFVTHYVQAQMNYTFATRDATQTGLSYDDNLIMLGLNLQI